MCKRRSLPRWRVLGGMRPRWLDVEAFSFQETGRLRASVAGEICLHLANSSSLVEADGPDVA